MTIQTFSDRAGRSNGLDPSAELSDGLERRFAGIERRLRRIDMMLAVTLAAAGGALAVDLVHLVLTLPL